MKERGKRTMTLEKHKVDLANIVADSQLIQVRINLTTARLDRTKDEKNSKSWKTN
jgi:hypothetical protein